MLGGLKFGRASISSLVLGLASIKMMVHSCILITSDLVWPSDAVFDSLIPYPEDRLNIFKMSYNARQTMLSLLFETSLCIRTIDIGPELNGSTVA